MIGYLKGQVILAKANYLILEVNNVGYKVYSTNPFAFTKNAEMFIYEHTRENISDLYGFSKLKELEVFEKLLDVSGIGPKGALTICANLQPGELVNAIEQSDINVFKTVPGIGPKVASKIILELKNKIVGDELDGIFSSAANDAIEAMKALGYKQQEIAPLLKAMPKEIQATKDILSYLMKNAGKK